jgi:uncharacterized pyridoxamine 5'-phosphate oxidase family protein
MTHIRTWLLVMMSIATFTGCNQENCKNEAPQACPACDCPVAAADIKDTAEPAPAADNAKPAVAEIPAAERDLEGQKEVFDFIKKQKTYYIATVENDQPRVRPFGTIELFEGNLYIQTGRKKKVSHQIEANGKIELCTFDGERWLRLAATAVADDRIEAQKHMLDAYPSLQKMYQAGDGNTVVYKLINVTATFDAFGAEQRVIKF